MINHIADTIVKESKRHDPQAIVYLGGSYANDTFNEKSDIDFLIISNKNRQLAKQLTKKLKHLPEYKNLDCKIITHYDLVKVRNNCYLFLYSFISKGRLLIGKPIHLKLSKILLRQEYTRILEESFRIKEMIEDKQDFDTIACLLFDLAKRHYYISNILDPTSCESLEQLLGKNFALLEQMYDSKIRGQGKIHPTLDTITSVRGQRSKKGFERLIQTISHLQQHEVILNQLLERFQKLNS